METETQQANQVLEATLGGIPEIIGEEELIDRIIKSEINGNYTCTISRAENGINENTYEKVDGGYKHICTNQIPAGHPRYLGLLDKLNKAGL